MEVILYKGFSKRNKSTKQVDNTVTKVTKNLVLKGECDKIRPMFFLADTDDYDYLKAWGWYYFIDGVKYDINGAQYITCSLDVYATWKTQILNTSAYVYLSSSDYDTLIPDDRVYEKVKVISDPPDYTNHKIIDSVFSKGARTYFLTTVNSKYGVSTYVMTKTKYDEVIAEIMNLASSSWLTSFFSELAGLLGAIVSVYELPISIATLQEYGNIGNETEDVWIGDKDIDLPAAGFEAYKLLDNHMQDGFLFDLNDFVNYTDFRKIEPFTKIRLGLPFVGVVPLSVPDFIWHDTTTGPRVRVKVNINLLTLQVAYTISSFATDQYVATYSSSFGREIPVGVTNLSQPYRGVMELIGGSAMALSGNPAMMAAGIGTAVKGFSDINKVNPTMIGAYQGNFGEYSIEEYYLLISEIASDIEPSSLTTLYGRPCHKVRQINGLTGYVETRGFNIDLDEIKEIKTMINEGMDSGVYIE